MAKIDDVKAKLPKWIPLSKVLRFSLSGYGVHRERAQEISKNNEQSLSHFGALLADQLENRAIKIRSAHTKANVGTADLAQLIRRLNSPSDGNNLSGLADESSLDYEIGRKEYLQFVMDIFKDSEGDARETNLWHNSISAHLEDLRKFATDEEWREICADIDKPAAVLPTSVAKVILTGIGKQQVITAFRGIHYDAEQWKKYLASPPVWLKECRTQRGTKSVKKHPALWNPVQIAIALTDQKRGVQIKKLDAVFVANKFLTPWCEMWTDKSELFR